MSSPSGSEQEGVLTYAQILDKFCLEKETTIMTALKACPVTIRLLPCSDIAFM